MSNTFDCLAGPNINHPEHNDNGAAAMSAESTTKESRRLAKKRAEEIDAARSRAAIDEALARDKARADCKEAERKAHRRDRKKPPLASQSENNRTLNRSVAAQNADLSRTLAGVLAHIGGLR